MTIETKICSKCGVEKELSGENFQFNKRLGKYVAHCKDCHKKDCNKRYAKNHEAERMEREREKDLRARATKQICTKCCIEKDLNKDNFYWLEVSGYRADCIDCCLLAAYEYNHRNHLNPKPYRKQNKIDSNAITQICSKCNIEKNLNDDNFYFRKENNAFRKECIECYKAEKNDYYYENREAVLNQNKKYRNTPEIKERNKKRSSEYYEQNKKPVPRHKIIILNATQICNKCNIERPLDTNNFYFVRDTHKFRKDCKDCCFLQYQEYMSIPENKQKKWDYMAEYSVEYNHRPDVRERENQRARKKYDDNPMLALHMSISAQMRGALKRVSLTKNGKSIEEILGKNYLHNLKSNLELLFLAPENLTPDGRVWMGWHNHGKYNAKTWVDDDYSTHTWQLDHTMPVSDFISASATEDDVQKCWDIENIRPLSAKQNVLDGARRTRHKKKSDK